MSFSGAVYYIHNVHIVYTFKNTSGHIWLVILYSVVFK